MSDGLQPNSLWSTDYKGEFLLGDKRYCYPLTVTDHASRFLLLCEAMESNKEKLAITAFERLFKERGLPDAIRSDNGVPFASPNGLFNLSKLSVWWLRLGISIERPASRQRLVANCRKGENVRYGAGWVHLHLFRRHVGEGSLEAGPGTVIDQMHDTEVDQLYGVIAKYKDIAGLDIAVNETQVVSRLLRQFNVVTRLSSWSDPKNVH